jgi:flagellar protein FlbT
VGNIRIYLKPNEKIFINGAVLKVDRKVSFELLNDVTFLLESHVMQKEDANTPIKQLYFVVQMMLMHPIDIEQPMALFKSMTANLLRTVQTQELVTGLKNIDVEVSTGKYFTGLKLIREMIPLEEEILGAEETPSMNTVMSEHAGSGQLRSVAGGVV